MEGLEGLGLPPLFELLLLLVVVYLVECVRTVGPRSLALRSLWPGRWRLVEPFHPSASWKRALVVGFPLPPLGAVYVVERLPILLGPSGMTVWPALAGMGGGAARGWSIPPDDAVHVRWSEAGARIRVSVKEAEVLVDGRVVARLGTRRFALALKELAEDLSRLNGDAEREQRLRVFLDARFDGAAIRARRHAFCRGGWPLVAACNLLFAVITFGWIAVLGFGTRLEHVLGLGGLAWLACGLNHWLTQRALLSPEERTPVGKRWINTLSPLALIRSADEVRAEVLGDFDPLAAAATVMPKDALSPGLRNALAELEWPLQPASLGATDAAGDGGARSDEQWLRAALQRRIEGVCAAVGLDAKALLHAAPEADVDDGAYCPRCHTQFTAASAPGSCPECEGVTLRRFGPALTPMPG